MQRLMRAFFFFQAEDGIRDLVRSRGLGDVYKRQDQHFALLNQPRQFIDLHPAVGIVAVRDHHQRLLAVSYTHLTLPTSDLV